MSLKFLLDSDICIYVMKRRSPSTLRRFDAQARHCALSVVSHGELCYGLARSSRPTEAAGNLFALLETVRVLPIPAMAAAHYGQIRNHLEKAGTPIGANDLWIASHALAANLTLITNNEREFRRVPGLSVDNWS